MKKIKNIALVAHDNRKGDLIEWVNYNYKTLLQHKLVCTGTTGRLVEEAINDKLQQNDEALPAGTVLRLKSGPLGGDQQLGALISEGRIDILFFLWDPMQAQPHDVDVKALLRIAAVYNVPIASNRSTADFIISSPLMHSEYENIVKDYSGYISRKV